jgi:4-amino-4-deoxy-L-arabinose transferase-like glycosyltransferase
MNQSALPAPIKELELEIAMPCLASDRVSERQRFLLLSLSAGVALVAHLLFLLLLPQPWSGNQSSDYIEYYQPVAQSLIAGNGFYLHSKPALTYPPGIPMLYAVAFWAARKVDLSEANALRIVEGVWLTLSAVLVCFLAMRFFRWKVALLASGLWSTYPFHLWLTKQPDATSLFSVLLLTSALLFFAWSSKTQNGIRYGVLLGVVLGMTALIKPFSIGLPLAFVALAGVCPIVGQRRSRIVFSACLLITYAATISPWEIWAWHVGGHWIPLCTNGANALIDGLTFGTERGLPPIALPEGVTALVRDAAANYPKLKSTSSIAHFVLTKVRQTPTAILELLLVKAARSWFGNESHRLERWIAIIQLLYLPFLFFGTRTVWKYGDTRQKNFALLAIVITAYFWIMTTVTAEAILRYMVPVTCLLVVLVAVAFEFLSTRFSENSEQGVERAQGLDARVEDDTHSQECRQHQKRQPQTF